MCATYVAVAAQVYEKHHSAAAASPRPSPNPNNPSEYCSTVPPALQGPTPALPPTVMVPGVLRKQGMNVSSVFVAAHVHSFRSRSFTFDTFCRVVHIFCSCCRQLCLAVDMSCFMFVLGQVQHCLNVDKILRSWFYGAF